MISPTALAAERDQALSAVGQVLGIASWPSVPLSWNRRLRRAGRAVVEARAGRPLRVGIELSPVYFEVYPEDLYGILVHEAVHVGLAVLREPFGHGPPFRRACERAGGLLHSRNLPGRVFQYRCPTCSAVLDRRRRPSGDRWCARCAVLAARDRVPPFTEARALVLVGVFFRGAEGRGQDDPVRAHASGG